MEPTKTKQKFIELRAQGYSFDKIAKELHKAKQTLIDWSKEFEEDIANLRALELESLQEMYYLKIEDRLKLYSSLLQKLRTEVESRDFTDIPTPKLFDLIVQCRSELTIGNLEYLFKSSEEVELTKGKRTSELQQATMFAKYGL
jgi:hypothetical protein